MTFSRSPRPAGTAAVQRETSADYPWHRRIVVPLLAVALLVRVLTDDRSSASSRHSGALNLSGVIALMLFLMAGSVLPARRRVALPAILAALWLTVWTVVALKYSGISTETVRESVRELSVVALAVIVYYGSVRSTDAARLVQLIGVTAAVLAFYQFATHSGMNVKGNIRAHGTFAHPNSAAMFFTIAATASLWAYLECGRHWFDAIMVALFTLALIPTFSIGGVLTLFVMFTTLGMLRAGRVASKAAPCLIAACAVGIFLITPLGAKRVALESSSRLSASAPGEANSSLSWRLDKWRSLLREWERAPLLGRGIGTTTTAEATATDRRPGNLAHNEYLRYLVETGAVGLTLLLLALAVLLRRLIILRRDDQREDLPDCTSLALTIVGGCLVNSLADNTLLNSPTCYATVLLIFAVLSDHASGAALASRALERQQPARALLRREASA